MFAEEKAGGDTVVVLIHLKSCHGEYRIDFLCIAVRCRTTVSK